MLEPHLAFKNLLYTLLYATIASVIQFLRSVHNWQLTIYTTLIGLKKAKLNIIIANFQFANKNVAPWFKINLFDYEGGSIIVVTWSLFHSNYT